MWKREKRIKTKGNETKINIESETKHIHLFKKFKPIFCGFFHHYYRVIYLHNSCSYNYMTSVCVYVCVYLIYAPGIISLLVWCYISHFHVYVCMYVCTYTCTYICINVRMSRFRLLPKTVNSRSVDDAATTERKCEKMSK